MLLNLRYHKILKGTNKAAIAVLISICLLPNLKAQKSLQQWDDYLRTTHLDAYVNYYEFKTDQHILHSILYFEYKNDPYLVETYNGKVTKVIQNPDLDLFNFIMENKSEFPNSNGKPLTVKQAKVYNHRLFEDTSQIKKVTSIKYKKFTKQIVCISQAQTVHNSNDNSCNLWGEILDKMMGALRGDQ